MGVQGLWSIVAPAGRRVNAETLEGRTVAVDSSIWMVQFIKAMRDGSGNMIRAAHLVGFFHRICKLLYYHIRPVFVFDGPPPPLKLATLMQRRQFREEQETNLKRTAEKLLLTRLKQRVISKASLLKKTRATAPVASNSISTPVISDVDSTQETIPFQASLERGSPSPVVQSDSPAFITPVLSPVSAANDAATCTIERTIEGLRRTRAVSDEAMGEEITVTSKRPKLSLRSEVPSSSQSKFATDLLPAAVSSSRVYDIHNYSSDDDIEIDRSDEALANSAGRRARRAAYYNSIPSEFAGFLSGRRRLDDIQIAASGIDNILAMPHSLIPKNSKVSNTSPAEEFNTNSRRSVQHPQAAKMFREAEDFKEYRILGEDGEERFIQLPLDSEIDPDVFKNLPPKLQYSILTQLRDAWFNNTRLRAVQAKDDAAAFSNIQIESFLRHVRTSQEIEKVKKVMAQAVHAETIASSSSGAADSTSGGIGVMTSEDSGELHHLYSASTIENKDFEANIDQRGTQGSVLQLPKSGVIRSLVSELLPDLNISGERQQKDEPMKTNQRTPGQKKHRRRMIPNLNDHFSMPHLKPLNCVEALGIVGAQPQISELEGSWCNGWLKLKSNPLEAFRHMNDVAKEQKTLALKIACEECNQSQLFENDEIDTEKEDSRNRSSDEFDLIYSDLGVENLFGTPEHGNNSEKKSTTTELPAVDASSPAKAPPSQTTSPNQVQFSSAKPKKIIQLVRKTVSRDELHRTTEGEKSCQLFSLENPISLGGLISDEDSWGDTEFIPPGTSSEVHSGGHFQNLDPLVELPQCHTSQLLPTSNNAGRERFQTENFNRSRHTFQNIFSKDDGAVQDSSPPQTLSQSQEEPISADIAVASSDMFKEESVSPMTNVGLLAKSLSIKESSSALPFEEKIDEKEYFLATSVIANSVSNCARSESKDGLVAEKEFKSFVAKHVENTKPSSLLSQDINQPTPAIDSVNIMNETAAEEIRMREPTEQLSGLISSRDIAESFSGQLSDIDQMAAELDEEAVRLESKLQTHKRDADIVTSEMQQEIRQLLKLCGLPYVDAPAEAEAQCAALTQLGLCEAVISDDSDSVVFGSLEIFRHFFDSKTTIELYDLDEIRDKIGLNKDSLVIMALLLGCDYTPGVNGIGIVNALEAVKVFNTLEGLMELKEWATDPGRVQYFVLLPRDAGIKPTDDVVRRLYKETHKRYRYQWIFPPIFPDYEAWQAFQEPRVDRSTEPFTWGVLDVEGIISFLHIHAGLEKQIVMQTLGPVLKRIEVRPRILRQPTLKEFFKPLPMTNEDAVAKIRSKRIERAIQQVKSTHNVIKTLTHTDTNIANPASLRDKSAVKKAKSKPRKQRTKKQPAATR